MSVYMWLCIADKCQTECAKIIPIQSPRCLYGNEIILRFKIFMKNGNWLWQWMWLFQKREYDRISFRTAEKLCWIFVDAEQMSSWSERALMRLYVWVYHVSIFTYTKKRKNKHLSGDRHWFSMLTDCSRFERPIKQYWIACWSGDSLN